MPVALAAFELELQPAIARLKAPRPRPHRSRRAIGGLPALWD